MKRTPTTREQAIQMAAKIHQSRENGTEATLQSQCAKQFAERFPEKRGRLFATFQNPTPEQHGLWVAKGMVAGVSDMIFIDDQFRVVGIEMKHQGSRHSRQSLERQCHFLINCCYRGYFCTSVQMFWDIINGGVGIDPRLIEKKMEKLSTYQF
jgi:hypothetical protein